MNQTAESHIIYTAEHPNPTAAAAELLNGIGLGADGPICCAVFVDEESAGRYLESIALMMERMGVEFNVFAFRVFRHQLQYGEKDPNPQLVGKVGPFSGKYVSIGGERK